MGRGRPVITRAQELELRELFRDVVMIRAGAALFVKGSTRSWYGRCEWCRVPKWLMVSHIEPVGQCRHLRFDPDNARAICKKCHLFTWHKAPRKAEAWIVSLMGSAARQALAARADAKGFAPDYTLTRYHLLAVRASLAVRAGHNPLLEGREA